MKTLAIAALIIALIIGLYISALNATDARTGEPTRLFGLPRACEPLACVEGAK